MRRPALENESISWPNHSSESVRYSAALLLCMAEWDRDGRLAQSRKFIA